MKQKKPESSITIPESEPNRFKDLLEELETAPDKFKKKFPTLSTPEQLGLLLLTTGMTRQSLLLSSPYAKQLVPMFPEHEIYITIKEIGLEDATGLLALMGPEQLLYFYDLEAWEKDLFNSSNFLAFLKAVSQCGEEKFALLLETADPEILTLVLKKNGFVSKLDIYQEPLEETDIQPFFTYDGFYRYHPKEVKLRPLLEALVRVLQARFPKKYGMVMESAYQDHYSEVEEEASRFRSNRLAEKGIPDFDAACEIYRPLTEEKFRNLVPKSDLGKNPSPKTAALYPIRWLPPDSLVHKALRTLADHPETDRIRMELAAIGNKVLIADGQEIKDLESLKGALQKVSGFLSIALEFLSDNDILESASWLTRTWGHFLFRFGYGQIVELVKKANRIKDQARFRWIDKYHYLADHPLEESLLGLLRPRPLFFEGENTENPEGFRQFKNMSDIRLTDNRLEAVKGLSGLFNETMSLSPERIKTLCKEGGLADRLDSVKWSHILQTFWAWKTLTGTPSFQILCPTDVQHFTSIIFPAGDIDSDKTVFHHYTRTLTDWLHAHLPDIDETPKKLIIDTMIKETGRMKEELSALNQNQPVDGRLIQCLCVKE